MNTPETHTTFLFNRFASALSMKSQPFLEDINRNGLASNSLQVLIAFFLLGAVSLTLPVMTLSSITHKAAMREQATRLQTQAAQSVAQTEQIASLTAQLKDRDHTIDLQQHFAAEQQAQIARQTTMIKDLETTVAVRDGTISTQVGTITTQAQLLEAVKTGLQKARQDHPFWSMVLDAIIRFLVEIGCSWLSALL